MSQGWLCDAVTLQHFASVGRLSLLCSFLGQGNPPYWTAGVRDEVLAAYQTSEPCREILGSPELGTPKVLDGDLRSRVARAQVRLGASRISLEDHLGEAESYVLADELGYGVITDDNSAHDLIGKRLGSARVLDTVEVLRMLVRRGDIDAHEATLIANAIRNNGRHLLRAHPPTLTEKYFRPDTP